MFFPFQPAPANKRKKGLFPCLAVSIIRHNIANAKAMSLVGGLAPFSLWLSNPMAYKHISSSFRRRISATQVKRNQISANCWRDNKTKSPSRRNVLYGFLLKTFYIRQHLYWTVYTSGLAVVLLEFNFIYIKQSN